MTTIKIHRPTDYFNTMRKYHLFIDGQNIGTIKNKQTIKIEIPAGRHSLIAKIDWCSSPELSFEIKDNDSKTFTVGGFKNARWIMPLTAVIIALTLLLPHAYYSFYKIFLILPPILFFSYYLTFGRKTFLTLREKNISAE